VEFLRAQLDEDEAVARRAGGGHLKGARRWVAGEANADGVRTEAGTPVTRFSWPYEMEHIARHDPQRVLADVAAKRAIVDGFTTLDNSRDRLHDAGLHLQWNVLRTVARALALPYADHPDYDEEWRP